jgi:hypothetical protein
MDITADTLNQFFSMVSVVILAIIAWYNKQRTESAATTAAATTATASTNANIAAIEQAATNTITAASTPSSVAASTLTQFYDVSKYGGISPANLSWDITRMRVLFRVSDTTRSVMLAGITSADARQSIIDQIAAAEKINEYHYTIGYASGYYEMQAVAEPVSQTLYRYEVVIKASGTAGKT